MSNLNEHEGRYDIQAAFEESTPTVVPPGCSLRTDDINVKNVTDVTDYWEAGEPYETDFVAYGTFADGTFWGARGSCCSCGFDVSGGTELCVARTEDDILRFFLTDEDRENLDVVL
jgi:hypothetical protein